MKSLIKKIIMIDSVKTELHNMLKGPKIDFGMGPAVSIQPIEAMNGF